MFYMMAVPKTYRESLSLSRASYLSRGLLVSALCTLISCGSGSSTAVLAPGNDIVNLELDFSSDQNGWNSGFADYPVGEDLTYELTSSFAQLPVPLQTTSGFNVSGKNLSDDLFMFIKKKFSGFAADSQYQIQFEVTIASNAPTGCIGAGGAPGEAVTIKAGSATIEPLALDDGNGFYVMNIDKGIQSNGGSNAIKIGDFANSKDCADKDFTYEFKTLNNNALSYSALTDSSGSLWFILATDSGFESTTSIYFMSGKIKATKI